jgi:hypothetical protein
MNHMASPSKPNFASQPVRAPRRRWLWYLAGCAALLLTTILAILGWLYSAITHVPEFYAEVLAAAPENLLQPLAEQAATNIQETKHEVQREETWELILLEDEVNAWLAYELPKRANRQWPKDWRDPRVQFNDHETACAVTHQSSIATVISWKITPRLTEQPNEVLLLFHSVHAGSLPLPLEKLLEPLQQQMHFNQIRIAWEISTEGLVARCTVPKQSPDFPGRDLALTALEVQAGQIRLAGTSSPRQKTKP